MVFQAVFGALASIIVMAFFRYREYRADAGGASLAGRDKMIAALQKLKAGHGVSAGGPTYSFRHIREESECRVVYESPTNREAYHRFAKP